MKLAKKKRIILCVTGVLLLATPIFLKHEKNSFELKDVYNTLGIESYLIKNREPDTVYVKCVFKNAGILHDTEKHGLSVIVGCVMFNKIGMSEYKTQNKLVDLGVRNLSTSVDGDDFEISFFVLKKHIDEALKFISQGITHPTFTDTDLESYKREFPEIVDLETSSYSAILFSNMRELLYPGHPYGLNRTGTAEDIASITSEDIYNFIKNKLNTSNLKVIVVGDVSRLDTAEYVQTLFGNMPENNENHTDNYIFKCETSQEKEKVIRKKDMNDIVAILHAVRIDNMSPLQEATARIMIHSLFSENRDFANSLKTEKIQAIFKASIIDNQYSKVMYLKTYIYEKDYDKYMKLFRKKFQKYQTTQNLYVLDFHKNSLIKKTSIGIDNLEDIDYKIEYKSLPFGKVSPADYSDIANKIFNLNEVKTVIIRK